jgi:hypothetical protein
MVVIVGRGVAVGGVVFRGRQATNDVIARKSIATTTAKRARGKQSPLKRLRLFEEALPPKWRLPRRQRTAARKDIGKGSFIK